MEVISSSNVNELIRAISNLFIVFTKRFHAHKHKDATKQKHKKYKDATEQKAQKAQKAQRLNKSKAQKHKKHKNANKQKKDFFPLDFF